MIEANQQKNPEESKVVALVNSEEITRSELDSYSNQIATIQKIPLPDKETEGGRKFERQALDQIINNTLLSQDAEKQEIKIGQEEINSQYAIIADQVGGEEKLNQALEKIGITSESLRKDLMKQNLIEKYFGLIKEKNKITVTEEEVKAFYDKQIAPQKPDLELKAIEPQIRQKLERQKLNYPVSEIIQNLRKEAEIKILI